MTSSATDRHDGGLAISQWSAPALLLVALIAALTLVACRGDGRPGDYVGGEFVTVSAGGGHTCGVRVDGSVACWGADSLGRTTPREGEFTSVSAGNQHTCGVRVDGSVDCWGSNLSGQAMAPEGEFASVSAGYHHTCGVRADGSIGIQV